MTMHADLFVKINKSVKLEHNKVRKL